MNSSDEQDWLEAFAVPRSIPITGIAERFESVLDTAIREETLQTFLTENPIVLTRQLPHCHFAVPKFRFGGKYVSDFLLPQMASSGTTWVLVELEPANAQLVTQSGHLADRVRTGIQQVRDWRDWLMDNRDEAIRPISRNGLGLRDIDDVWGTVVVGRRNQVTDRFNQLRNQILREARIEIMTYDRMLERFKARAMYWDQWDRYLFELTGKNCPKA
jgi:hypothetical protein